MFCFFQHDISDDVNAEEKREDAVGSFAGKESSERPAKWNCDLEAHRSYYPWIKN